MSPFLFQPAGRKISKYQLCMSSPRFEKNALAKELLCISLYSVRMRESKPYSLKCFKGYLPQILLGPFLSTLSHIKLLVMMSSSEQNLYLIYLRLEYRKDIVASIFVPFKFIVTEWCASCHCDISEVEALKCVELLLQIPWNIPLPPKFLYFLNPFFLFGKSSVFCDNNLVPFTCGRAELC